MFDVMDGFSVAVLIISLIATFLIGRMLRAMMVWRPGSPRSRR